MRATRLDFGVAIATAGSRVRRVIRSSCGLLRDNDHGARALAVVHAEDLAAPRGSGRGGRGWRIQKPRPSRPPACVSTINWPNLNLPALAASINLCQADRIDARCPAPWARVEGLVQEVLRLARAPHAAVKLGEAPPEWMSRSQPRTISKTSASSAHSASLARSRS